MKKSVPGEDLEQHPERARAPPGPGPCQPPRKQAAPIAEMIRTSMYSAMKNEPKRMPPNSVL